MRLARVRVARCEPMGKAFRVKHLPGAGQSKIVISVDRASFEEWRSFLIFAG